MKRSLAVILLLVGCAQDAQDFPFDKPDKPQLNALTVEKTGADPIFIAYRDGDGAWQQPMMTATGYLLRVDNAFQLVTVCQYPRASFLLTRMTASTFDEAMGQMTVSCPGSSNSRVDVSGTMAQPGMVTLGGSQTAEGTAPNWSFKFEVPVGTRDLIAIGGDRMAIRRDLTIETPTVLSTIDVDAEGTAMQEVPLTIDDGRSDEQIETAVDLYTTNNFAELGSHSGNVAHVAPAALLRPKDEQRIRVEATSRSSATGDETRRGVDARYTDGSPTAFTLPPQLSGVQFGATGARWSTLPPGTVTLFLSGESPVWLLASASPGWLAGKTELAINTDIPGLQAAWTPGVITSRDLSVHGCNDDDDVCSFTSVVQFVDNPIAPKQWHGQTFAHIADWLTNERKLGTDL